MRAALTVARELLRCRLMESGRDALLERVAELLDTTATGALPFCYQLTLQAAAGSHGRPRRTRVFPGAPGGLVDINMTHGGGRPAAPAPPQVGVGTSVAPHGPSEASRYHPQDATLRRAAWSAGHYGEVFGVTAPKAYVPRLMDQGYRPEDDPDSFLGPGWEEEALGAEAFQEPPDNPANHAVDNRYMVPLIPQEQAYANHGSQENQVTTAAGGPSSATSLPPGGSRWGPQERSQEPDPTPRRIKQGPPRR